MDKNKLRTLIFVFIWLVIWQVATILVNNSILLAGPVETAKAALKMVRTTDYWRSILNTTIKISAGFLAGTLSGILLAFPANRYSVLRDFFAPVVSAVKSVPVASFVVLVLIWSGTEWTALVITSLVVFPIVYLSTLEGLMSIDRKLIEMADIFRMKPRYRLRYIYLEGLRPFLAGSLSIAAGMSWKSGIAAEVISRPKLSMGNGLYNAKVYLMTEELFAWTITAVLLAYISERLIRLITRRIFGR